jgi:hypothetical protein
LEAIPRSRAARWRSTLWARALNFNPLEWLGFTEPKDPHAVVVQRRSDGATVATFEHEYLVDAITHRDSIVERLDSEQIFDVCRELSIDVSQVGTPQDA